MNPGPSGSGGGRGRPRAAEAGRSVRAAAVDPDVDLHLAADRAETAGARRWAVLGAVAAGGALGGVARYGLTRPWPSPWSWSWPHDGFPWGLLLVNLVGCALIGVLMAALDACRAPALTRPFLGVGVLGGFTSFSAYAADGLRLLGDDAPGAALGYLGGTLLGALGAVWAATAVTRRAVATWRAWQAARTRAVGR
ncbi:CrcB family protein [Streptomyces sp. JJ66]|uniref:FluC/FEX family fluoride channel n=1 Tax=Streptomyces sp. JJ66 TaxID=2803843 RepID=UPI001C5A28A9|nr:CrcB family protein [Streptomyces sp. JJ66]MBW1604677.1 CrcB family protein [Streptomyces sp. JJ66]